MKTKITYAAQGGRSGPSLHQPGLSIASLLNSKQKLIKSNPENMNTYLLMDFL